MKDITIGIIIDDITRFAGTERAASNLANLLINQLNYNVHLISIEMQNEKPAYRLKNEIIVHNLRQIGYTNKNISFRISKYPSIILRIRQIAKDNKIDTLIGTGHAVNFLLPLINRGSQIKLIGCEHFDYYGSPVYSRIIRNYLYTFLNKVVVLTERDRNKYRKRGLETVTIPNSLSFVCNQEPDYSAKRIISVGRLTKQKGFDLLIKAATIVVSKYPDWHFVIFGDGELREELLSQIAKSKIQANIEISEPTKDIKSELLKSSIFALSSRWEGLPMTLLEAMEVGLPIVSFDCPTGPKEIITHQEDGLLVEEENPISFAQALDTFIESIETRSKFGAKAKENIKRYSEANIAALWEQIL